MKNPLSQRGTGAFTRKDFLCVIAILGSFALAVFWRSPASAPENLTPSPAVSLAAAIHPQNFAAVATPTNPSVARPIGSAEPMANPKPASAFDDFSNWVGLFTNSSASFIAGERLAWKRREAMLELIQNDPQRAIELSVPFALRQKLPPQITKFFEQQVDGRGDFLLAMGEDFSNGNATTYRSVQLGGKNYQAFVYGRRRTEVSQTSIPLHGIVLDGKMAVAAEPLRALSVAEATALDKNAVQPDVICSVSGAAANARGQPVYAESGGGVMVFCGMDHFNLVNRQWAAAEGNTSAVSGANRSVVATIANDNWTHGRKNVLYMRVNFPDDLTEPLSEAAAYATMNDVNTFYAEGSYDLTSLTATVTPLLTLPQTKAYYAADPGTLIADARVAALAAGFDTANYPLDLVAFTAVPGYKFAGLAAVHGKSLWLNDAGASVGVVAHEFGHNYGLLHANFWNTITNFSMIGPGTNLEYGNIFDTMGLAGAGNFQFNANHKNLLDWLKADAVQGITSNGVYRIYPFDVPGSLRATGRIYAAFIKKDSQRDYWLEFRQKFTSNPWLENGLSLNWSAWNESSGGSQLIDTTPGSPDAGDSMSRDDAAVVIGRTYSDNVAGVHITPLLRGSTGADPWIDYQVNLGAFSGNQPPDLAVEVDQTNVAPGTLVHFHATATDPDGDALAFAWTFDDLTFSTNNLPWTSKIFSTPGDHVVRCVVSDMKGGEASANVVVSAGASAGYRVSGQVTDTNGAPLEGVLVGNGEIDAGTFIGGWTDSNGRYILVNVSSANSFNLNAFQFGYAFINPTWSNPVQPTNDMVNLDFVALPLPWVNISADTNVVVESDGSAHFFTVTRTGSVSNDLSVNIVLAGTATPNSDYTLVPDLSATNAITIPAGTNSVTFVFHALNDSLVEGPETVTITLLDDDLNMDHPNYALAPLAEATITILDDDAPSAPTVTVTTTTPEISENGMDNGQFVFTRNGSLQNDLLVFYSTSGTATSGVDYTALPNVVLIPAGQNSTTIPLVPIDDKNVEPDETVIATISANPAYTVGSPAAATITILDSDFMTVTIAPTGDAAEPSTPGTFTVKRDGDLTEALVVNYNVSGTASNGVDYAALSGTLTIPAGAPSASIIIAPIDDTLLEGDESVIVSITNSVNYDVGTPGSATLFIRDNEKPTVNIQTTVDNVSEQGDVPGQFKLTRTGSSGDLTVFLGVSGTANSGIDYVPIDNPVTIPNGSSSVTIDVIPFHDLILEPTETVKLTVLAGTNYNVGSPATASLNILDDGTSQVPGVGFSFAASSVVESRSPGIAVALSLTSSVPVTVDYRVIGGTAPASRYSLPPGTLTIPTNTWVVFIPLQIVNDSVVEPPQTIRVALFNPVNATLDGIKIHTYTILDDDACSVSVTATSPNAAETGLVAGNFRIARAGPTNASQLVNFQITGTASAPTDYAPLGNSAIIPAGAAFVDLPVLPTDDNTMELAQTVVLTLTSATNANIISPNVATVTIADNDTNNLPIVIITSTNHPYAVEGGGTGEFLFTRTGSTSSALTISFTLGGTATAGTRYATLPNPVTIPAGQTSVALPVVAVDDTLVEGEQTVIASLTEGINYRTAYPAFATVTIQDNDQRVWLDASDFRAAKYRLDPGQFTFSRFGTTNTPITVSCAISGTASNGLDYFRITNFMVIPAGSLTATLPILPQHTGIVKGPATVILTLLPSAAFALSTPTSGTVTIDDDEPMLTLTAVVTNVLEGSGSNGVFRLTRTGDPQFDFTAHIAAGGTATYGVDYPPFPTNIYFSCGVTSIDLFVTPTNELVVEGDESVTTRLLPDPAYTILSPSNAVLTIADAGTNITPFILLTRPLGGYAFIAGTNNGLVLLTSVNDDPSNTFTWSVVSGPDGANFGNTNTNNTTITFTNLGVYVVRLTVDNGQLQSHADVTAFVAADLLTGSNLLHWPFDDGGGTNVLDVSGADRNGVLSGAPAWITNGVLGGALQFSGTNDFVRLTSGTNFLNGLNQFTLSLWIRPATTNLNEGFFAAADSGTNATLEFTARNYASCGNNTNVIEVTFPTSKGVVHRISANGAVQPFQWQQVALAWSNGLAPALYINGQPDQPVSGLVAASGMLTDCPQFLVGKGFLDVAKSLNGAIDDVRVFSRMLSANEIFALDGWAVTNHAPVVDAGSNVTVQFYLPVTLTGTVTDDGLPVPPGLVTNFWTYLGTNDVTIPDPTSLTNTFVFTNAGDYVFQLMADDGQAATFALVTVTVIPPTEVDISADIPDAYELGPVPGNFTLTRNGDTNALTVYLAISGTASNGVDYVTLTNAVTFADGSNSIALPVAPFLDYNIEGDESVIVSIVTNIAYFIGTGQATVTIHDSPYGLWSIQNFTLEQLTHPEISGPSADFDHDGIRNFAEYAFNLDPTVSNTPPPYQWGFETDTNDNRLHLTLTYTRRLPPRDVEYGVYVSTNLLNWNTGTNFVEEFLHTNDLSNLNEIVKTRALMPFPSATNLFMNIRVWLQQVPAP